MKKNTMQYPRLILARCTDAATAERLESNARHLLATCSGTDLIGRFSALETHARWHLTTAMSRETEKEHVDQLKESSRFGKIVTFKDPGVPITAAIIERLTRS